MALRFSGLGQGLRVSYLGRLVYSRLVLCPKCFVVYLPRFISCSDAVIQALTAPRQAARSQEADEEDTDDAAVINKPQDEGL